jgi:hypothetical protein
MKHSRLLDFQVFARASGLVEGEQRPINEALFSTFEPVRLWLRERVILAPFGKIAISLADEASSARWHGNVSSAIGICQVTEAVDLPTMRKKAGDHRWVLAIVAHALACVAESAGWRSPELEGFVEATSDAPLPLVHHFDGLAQVDTASGFKCVPWLSTRPGETRIGVRLGGRDVTLRSEPGPLYLEDTFPVAKSAIRGRDFLLLDKSGQTLATVPIDISVLH